MEKDTLEDVRTGNEQPMTASKTKTTKQLTTHNYVYGYAFLLILLLSICSNLLVSSAIEILQSNDVSNTDTSLIDDVVIPSYPTASVNDVISSNHDHQSDSAVSKGLSTPLVNLVDQGNLFQKVPEQILTNILNLFHIAASAHKVGPIEVKVTTLESGDSIERFHPLSTQSPVANEQVPQIQQVEVVMFPPFYTEDTPHYPAPALDVSSPDDRAATIKSEFLYAYHAYEKYAWGQDELRPVSREGQYSYGMSLTMVDSLTTMIMMNCTEEFERALDFLSQNLHFEHQQNINVFETTIRVLGSLLSSYALTSRDVFLEKARELGDQLMYAFGSPTGLPFGTISFDSRVAYNPPWTNSGSSLSEVGTLQLEFQYLSLVTGNDSYAYAVDKPIGVLNALNISLYPLFISVNSGDLLSEVYTLGARVDSLYEYFLKQYILSKKSPSRSLLLEMYERSVDSIITKLLAVGDLSSNPDISNLVYIAEMHQGQLYGKVDHLVCFFPGVLALGAFHNVIEDKQTERQHLFIAKSLMKMCVEMYFTTATGLAPEIVKFRERTATGQIASNTPPIMVDVGSTHSLLRPETVESLFVLYRVTHDPIYQEWGWQIFQALVQYARLPNGCGYSGLKDVRDANLDANALPWSNWNDHTESFFYSETLKYLYLLNSPDSYFPLDEWVFNTEAHPFPIRTKEESGLIQAYEDGYNTLVAIRSALQLLNESETQTHDVAKNESENEDEIMLL